ncbi:phospholipase D-like domain-containing protein [Nocardia gipuzkoensis]
MAGVLESLRPLEALMSQADDPLALSADLARLAASGAEAEVIVATLTAAVTDVRLVEPVLRYADVLDDRGIKTASAAVRLAQVQVLIEMVAADHWELVLTIPEFLRETLDRVVERHGPNARPRSTLTAIAEIASSARRSIVIAAPFLHAGFVETLRVSVSRVLAGGGQVTVITRALRSKGLSPANIAAVSALRTLGVDKPGMLRVCSWDEPSLGVHFKVAIADDERAYLGSANLTPGGMREHAEAGVYLRGRRVFELGRWLAAVADELERRSNP